MKIKELINDTAVFEVSAYDHENLEIKQLRLHIATLITAMAYGLQLLNNNFKIDYITIDGYTQDRLNDLNNHTENYSFKLDRINGTNIIK